MINESCRNITSIKISLEYKPVKGLHIILCWCLIIICFLSFLFKCMRVICGINICAFYHTKKNQFGVVDIW